MGAALRQSGRATCERVGRGVATSGVLMAVARTREVSTRAATYHKRCTQAARPLRERRVLCGVRGGGVVKKKGKYTVATHVTPTIKRTTRNSHAAKLPFETRTLIHLPFRRVRAADPSVSTPRAAQPGNHAGQDQGRLED